MALAALSGCGLFTSLDGLATGSTAAGDAGDAGPEAAAASDASASSASAADATCTLKSTGFRSGLDAANVGNGVHWSNEANALAPDGAKAEAVLFGSASETAFLRASRFELAIPTSASIRGVTLRVTRSSNGNVTDAEVRLAPDGTPGGANQQLPDGGAWPAITGSEGSVVYGGPTETWGLTLTPATVNTDAFGAAVKARYTGTSGNNRAFLDGIEIEVTYCE